MTATPRKFRKKPVVIEAMQWTGDNTQDVIDWINKDDTGPYGNRTAHYVQGRVTGMDVTIPNRIAIVTLEGLMHASLMDWIIRGIKGEFYPHKPDFWSDVYEEVEDETADA